ncbi:kinesin-like protein KIN-14Q isoform X2 [Tanacetum coccineum]
MAVVKIVVVSVDDDELDRKEKVILLVALTVFLAHIGWFVPADAAKVGLIDRIFCVMGGKLMTAKQSTFMIDLHQVGMMLRFNEGAKERKVLYNKIRKLKGNIRVFCRSRPLNSVEIAEGASVAFDLEGSKDGELKVKSNVAFKKNFKFDLVFSLKQPKAMFLRIHPHLQHRFLMDVTHAYLLMDKLEPERLLQLREQMKTEYIEVLCPVLHEKGVDVCLALLQRISDLKEASHIVVLLPDIA